MIHCSSCRAEPSLFMSNVRLKTCGAGSTPDVILNTIFLTPVSVAFLLSRTERHHTEDDHRQQKQITAISGVVEKGMKQTLLDYKWREVNSMPFILLSKTIPVLKSK